MRNQTLKYKFEELELAHYSKNINGIIQEYENGSGSSHDAYHDPELSFISGFNLICVMDPTVSAIDFYNQKVNPFVPYTQILREKKTEKISADDFFNTLYLKPFNTFVPSVLANQYKKENPQAKQVGRLINIFTDTIPDLISQKLPTSIQYLEKDEEMKMSFAKLKLSTVLQSDSFTEAKEILRKQDHDQLLNLMPSKKFQSFKTLARN